MPPMSWRAQTTADPVPASSRSTRPSPARARWRVQSRIPSRRRSHPCADCSFSQPAPSDARRPPVRLALIHRHGHRYDRYDAPAAARLPERPARRRSRPPAVHLLPARRALGRRAADRHDRPARLARSLVPYEPPHGCHRRHRDRRHRQDPPGDRADAPPGPAPTRRPRGPWVDRRIPRRHRAPAATPLPHARHQQTPAAPGRRLRRDPPRPGRPGPQDPRHAPQQPARARPAPGPRPRQLVALPAPRPPGHQRDDHRRQHRCRSGRRARSTRS